MHKIQFKKWACVLEFAKYGNGRTAMILNEASTGERIATASINLEEYLAAGEVAIKNYSENEGMLDALVEAKIISTPVRIITHTYPEHEVNFPVCMLLVKP